MNSITIKKQVYDDIISHSKAVLPYEGCGLLVGHENHITTFLPLINESSKFYQFKVSEKQLNHILKEIKFMNQEVIAIYHSHPMQRALPSSLDLLNHPDHQIKMVIVSLKFQQPVMKCFTIQNRSYKETLFKII